MSGRKVKFSIRWILPVIVMAQLGMPELALAKNWNTKSTNYADLEAVTIENSFPKHKAVLQTE